MTTDSLAAQMRYQTVKRAEDAWEVAHEAFKRDPCWETAEALDEARARLFRARRQVNVGSKGMER